LAQRLRKIFLDEERKEVNLMKIVTSLLAALILASTLIATATSARADDSSEARWQSHIQKMREHKEAQE